MNGDGWMRDENPGMIRARFRPRKGTGPVDAETDAGPAPGVDRPGRGFGFGPRAKPGRKRA